MNKVNDIQYMCQLIHETFTIPVRFLSTNKDILYECISNDTCSPFYSTKKEQLSDLYQEDDLDNFPLIKTNHYLENFLVIHITNHTHTEGTFIIGPSVYPKVSEEMVIKLMNEFDLTTKAQDGIDYYHSVPMVKKTTLIHVGILLYYMIYNTKLDVNTVWKKNKLLEKKSYTIVNPDLYISTRRQNSPSKYDISLERQFFTNIKEGNKSKVIEYVYAFPQEDATILSKGNQLRNQKNNGIIAITLATRYAIDGNLPSEIAFSLSDLYIQTIEQLDNMYSVNRLIEDALCTFADRVKEYNVHKYSNTISMCLDHITKNIHHEITLNDIASTIHVHPSYLSKLFREEVGISFSEYIQRERVEEAKKLLTLTTYPLSDICTWLNFNDQSYFTKVFKRFTNTTPRQYRQKHAVL